MQRADEGAIPRRARYNSAMMDGKALGKGEKYSALPESYVIFITERDVLKGGLPIYHIRRVIEETSKNFDDGTNIIYVNGSFRGDTELGKLMHDFFCKEAKKIINKILSRRVRTIKNNEVGVLKVCSSVEKLILEAKEKAREEGRAEGRAEGKEEGARKNTLENIRNLMETLNLTVEAAMKALKISPELQKELAPLI